VINLDRSPERWAAIHAQLERLGIAHQRVPAVDAREIGPGPWHDVDQALYDKWHHRPVRPQVIANYRSQIKALRIFVASGTPYGLMLEDDAVFESDAVDALHAAIDQGWAWDILDLEGLRSPPYIPLKPLTGRYRLAVDLFQNTGSAAYLVSRQAALRMIECLLPIRFPYDYAFNRSWVTGLRFLRIAPHPAHQSHEYLTEDRPKGPDDYKSVGAMVPVTLYRAWRELQHVGAALRATADVRRGPRQQEA
jgi:glycosyl transferase family 25